MKSTFTSRMSTFLEMHAQEPPEQLLTLGHAFLAGYTAGADDAYEEASQAIDRMLTAMGTANAVPADKVCTCPASVREHGHAIGCPAYAPGRTI